MNFEEILKRADLNSLRAFIMIGAEDLDENPQLTYSEQIKSANHNIDNILKEKFPVFEELDEIESNLNEQIYTLEKICFEMGMLTGAKIVIQALKKMKEI